MRRTVRKFFENKRSLKRGSGIEEVGSSSEEGLVCHGKLNDKNLSRVGRVMW
jgi:hypothetical protein